MAVVDLFTIVFHRATTISWTSSSVSSIILFWINYGLPYKFLWKLLGAFSIFHALTFGVFFTARPMNHVLKHYAFQSLMGNFCLLIHGLRWAWWQLCRDDVVHNVWCDEAVFIREN